MWATDTSWSWLSAHVHFDGDIYSLVCDSILRTVVLPFVRRAEEEGWIRRYFFVRYAETGSHVRLRLWSPADANQTLVRSALERHVADIAANGGLRLGDGPGASRSSVELRWATYEPEWDRYCGPAGVELSERIFHASSRLCAHLLDAAPTTDHEAKLGRGIVATLVLFHTFGLDLAQAASLAHTMGSRFITWFGSVLNFEDLVLRFREGFQRQADKGGSSICSHVWNRMDANDPLPLAFEDYRSNLIVLRRRFDKLIAEGKLVQRGRRLTNRDMALDWLLPSHAHMTMNRLGIDRLHEAYLYHLIGWGLKECG